MRYCRIPDLGNRRQLFGRDVINFTFFLFFSCLCFPLELTIQYFYLFFFSSFFFLFFFLFSLCLSFSFYLSPPADSSDTVFLNVSPTMIEMGRKKRQSFNELTILAIFRASYFYLRVLTQPLSKLNDNRKLYDKNNFTVKAFWLAPHCQRACFERSESWSFYKPACLRLEHGVN